ncbi:hypothetical protein [Sulfobacillus thermosulfidooxidans]|uniref:hypothetical protein n=1 Tax=Sulfobacillus thermosulfidooxidans TaxID=28034 RepID=UPI0006B41287|nr:hypothetical protein [Sulfobacillus thermosulfidooxidans]
MLTRPNWQYLLVAAILGIIQFLIGLAAPFHTIVISYILDFLILVVAFIAGQHAKISSGHPGWFASATGAIYGFLAGITPFFVTITANDLKRQLHHHVVSSAQLQQIVKIANSPVAHFTDWLLSVLTYGILTLIIGSIGGLVIKKPSDRDAI